MKIIDRFLKENRDFSKKNSAKAIVEDDNGQILIIRRQNDEGGGGNWDIPGGHIEKGENQKDALIREVFEETNLKISDIKKVKTITLKIPETGVDSDMNIYKAKCQTTNVELKPATWEGADGKPEHTQYCWISKKEDLETRPMIDQLKTLLLSQLK